MFGFPALALLMPLALVRAIPLGPALYIFEKRGVDCNPWASVDDVPISFTLLAANTNDDTIQRPLGLGVISGYQEGIAVVATAETIAENFATNFTMVNSSITSVALPTSTDVYLSMYVATTSGLLEFMSKAHSATELPVASYCEEFNTSPHGVEFPYTIDVYGDPDNFSLCTTWDGATDIVVYQPTNGTTLPYDGNTCVPVAVHAIHDSD